MKERLRIAWLLKDFDGRWAALKYLFGRYPLADWEIELISSPSQRELL